MVKLVVVLIVACTSRFFVVVCYQCFFKVFASEKTQQKTSNLNRGRRGEYLGPLRLGGVGNSRY